MGRHQGHPDPKKISNQIYHTFKDYGYEVYGVNPKYEEMDDGSKIYSRLEDLPKTPEAVDFVASRVTMDHLQGMDPKIYPNIWLQPGTYNDDIEVCRGEGLLQCTKGPA